MKKRSSKQDRVKQKTAGNSDSWSLVGSVKLIKRRGAKEHGERNKVGEGVEKKRARKKLERTGSRTGGNREQNEGQRSMQEGKARTAIWEK